MKFILTAELGRLAKWLRILGFDAVYVRGSNFSSLLIQALRDNRIILSRNTCFINRAKGVKLIQIESQEVNKQLKQIINDLSIVPDAGSMFKRCLICNAVLSAIQKQQIKDKVPAYVFQTQGEFFICPVCQRVYWPGTHWGKVKKILEEIGA